MEACALGHRVAFGTDQSLHGAAFGPTFLLVQADSSPGLFAERQ